MNAAFVYRLFFVAVLGAAGCGFAPVHETRTDGGALVCLGDSYDVDGRDANGCEYEDAPLQDTPERAVAVMLPDVADKALGNPVNLAAHIYGDERLHDSPPASRPNGLPDWYKVTAVGDGDPNQRVGACLSITAFPPEDIYDVCITEAGVTDFGTNACQQVAGGGGSVCVRPASQPQSGGPFYVRVRKLAGPNTALSYALFLSH